MHDDKSDANLKILFIGDIIGKTGRNILLNDLLSFEKDNNIDLTIANVENIAGGFGVTEKSLNAVLEAGVDICTSGNHIWDRKDAIDLFGIKDILLRPANYPESAPGKGHLVYNMHNGETVGVINISGRIFMQPLENPFEQINSIIEEIKKKTSIIIVDFHAEATSEKIAFGWYLDGKVSAVIGTHTHVQTADERILPGGTAYITDVGMTGAHDSVIGMEKNSIIQRFINMLPSRFEPATGDPRMSYVILYIDKETGFAKKIDRGQYFSNIKNK